MTARATAASVTLRAKTPMVSSDSAEGLRPARLTAPKLGLQPTTPQKEAGLTIEPAVCVPSDRGTIRSATAAAEPLEEPPGVWAGLRGLAVRPG